MDPLEVVARLARVRERTCAELRPRLEAKGFGAPEIEAALKRAVELGYVNDERAARALVERWLARGASRRFLEDKLAAAGVAAALQRAVLADLPGDRALAKAALARWSRGAAVPWSRRARFLASKGHDESLIEELLGE